MFRISIELTGQLTSWKKYKHVGKIPTEWYKGYEVVAKKRQLVINAATQTSKKVKQAEINNRLLTLIAKKLNATEKEISEAWDA